MLLKMSLKLLFIESLTELVSFVNGQLKERKMENRHAERKKLIVIRNIFSGMEPLISIHIKTSETVKISSN